MGRDHVINVVDHLETSLCTDSKGRDVYKIPIYMLWTQQEKLYNFATFLSLEDFPEIDIHNAGQSLDYPYYSVRVKPIDDLFPDDAMIGFGGYTIN